MPTISSYSFHKDYDNFFESIQSKINCNFSGFNIERTAESIWIELDKPLRIEAEDIAVKHIRPEKLVGVEILINFRICINIENYKNLYQNTSSSNLSVTVRAISESGTSYKGFHFDLDNSCSDQNQLHPKYHCQFLVNPEDINTFRYGDALQLDIPRFTHFPMELILGTSFVLANFLPNIFDELHDNRVFVKLQQEYQNHYWKPYIQALNSLLEPVSEDFSHARQLQPYWMI